jgi:hypothetical protein
LSAGDPKKAERVMSATTKMNKIYVQALKAAAAG